MKPLFPSLTATILLLILSGITTNVQSQARAVKKAKVPKPDTALYAPGPLFNSEEVLQITLSGKLKEVFSDRTTDTSTYYPATIQYNSADQKAVSIKIQIKSRGNFRRKKENCSMPPILLNLEKEAKLKTTLFQKQNKLKLVTPCRGQEYVVREYLVYKLYNLLSPQCMKARLVQVIFNDESGKVKTQTQYGILIEDPEKAARRSGYYIHPNMMVKMEELRRQEFTRMAVFQYLIGNTDWSVPYLHNIRLAYSKGNEIPVPIPYDFDHSGIVSAPYAMPAEQLEMTSVRERRYRGYCQNMAAFDSTFALFNRLKDDIYKVYVACPFLDEKYVKNTVKYLDDFYKTINTPKLAEREFTDPCRRKERVVIMGLQNAD